MRDQQHVADILEQVSQGRLPISDALTLLDAIPSGQSMPQSAPAAFTNLGFANVDLGRKERCGFPEVVLAQGKTSVQIIAIAERLVPEGGCLVTRLTAEQATALENHFPLIRYNPLARTAWLGPLPRPSGGRVLVVTAGTSDLPVACEAAETAIALGSAVRQISDVGVAGLHRLLARVSLLRLADVIVVAAGMEGTLPSVVGGLVACPVIAVPTSIGYGTHFGGLTPLLAMLNSCAANVAVVNVDAGFCAGYLAALITRHYPVTEQQREQWQTIAETSSG